jgi:hypothetical protein
VGDLWLWLYPPYRARLDRRLLADPEIDVPATELPRALDPAEPQPLARGHSMGGRPVVSANALQIDVIKNGEFERRVTDDHGTPIRTFDPPRELIFEFASSFITGLRDVARASQLHALSPSETVWRVTYLDDDGSELPPDPVRYRTQLHTQSEMSAVGLSRALAADVAVLPDHYEPLPSSRLMLDAWNLLPAIGPAVVLAFSAIEMRIDSALDIMARRAEFDGAFWAWLTERDGQYRKEPSIDEKLDALLRGVAGVSLKDEPRLWHAFLALREARNSFAHAGRAEVHAQPVTLMQAQDLLQHCDAIIDWIEAFLPEENRRPALETPGGIESEILIAPNGHDEVGALTKQYAGGVASTRN